MSQGYRRELLAAATQLGFVNAGMSGSGHYRLLYPPTGEHYTIPATPSEYRGYRNAVSEMERIAGKRLPRPNRGHFAHRRVQPMNLQQTDRERAACTERDHIEQRATEIRRKVTMLIDDDSRRASSEARRLVSEYLTLTRRAEQMHLVLPPLVGAVE